MAKSSKKSTSKSKVEKSVEDAVEVDVPAVGEGQEDNVEAEASETSVDEAPAEVNEVDEGAAPKTTDDSSLEMDIVDDTPEVDAEEPAGPESVAPTPEKSGSGFLPLLMGGLVAGAIGYGVATYFPLAGEPDDVSVQLATQAEQIAALEAQLAAQPEVDLSGVEAEIAALGTQVGEQVDGLTATVEEQVASLDARLLEVEKRPSGDGTLSDTALAAYQRELEELRADLDAQQETVMSAAAQAEADLAAAREEAERLEQEALAAAEAAEARAALNRIATAVETGAPFADALAGLDADVPAALSDTAETGVATTADLVAGFPAAARAALATARAEGVSDDAGGLGGFLRSQFDVRSTTPQEGDGPDAVLSRAEGAVKEGRVADALAELEALPEVARAELTDWTARAQERSDVLDALATLSETYN